MSTLIDTLAGSWFTVTIALCRRSSWMALQMLSRDGDAVIFSNMDFSSLATCHAECVCHKARVVFYFHAGCGF